MGSENQLMSLFAPLMGQAQAVTLLTQAVQKARIAPAYLFTGSNGIGKSLAAQCFVQRLLAPSATVSATLRSRIQQRNHPDLLWVEPTYLHQGKRFSASEAAAASLKRKSPPIIRLEQIREVAQFLARAPLEASRCIVVIEQAETMAEAAANALLKTLEEPGQATLILIAPAVESILPTLVSRCQRIPFYRLPPAVMAQVLQQAGYAEILQHPEILQLAQGSPGDAIAHWQQLQEIPAELLQVVTHPPHSHREALSLARQIDKTVEVEAQRWLIDYLQQNYWQQATSRAVRQPIDATFIHLLEKARQSLLQNVQPRLVWEVTLLVLVQ